MAIDEHLERLFGTAKRIFGESVVYEQQGNQPKEITAVILKENILDASGTIATIKKAIVSKYEIERPVYNDKMMVSGVKWTVEKIEKTAPEQWELTLRNDEKLIY